MCSAMVNSRVGGSVVPYLGEGDTYTQNVAILREIGALKVARGYSGGAEWYVPACPKCQQEVAPVFGTQGLLKRLACGCGWKWRRHKVGGGARGRRCPYGLRQYEVACALAGMEKPTTCASLAAELGQPPARILHALTRLYRRAIVWRTAQRVGVGIGATHLWQISQDGAATEFMREAARQLGDVRAKQRVSRRRESTWRARDARQGKSRRW